MSKGSHKGSGYGGMKTTTCPRCGCNYKKSYQQIQSGNPVCNNRKKCTARARKRGLI